MKQVGYGVVGCGMIARFHLKALQNVPDAKAVAVFDVSEAAAQKLGQETGLAYYSDLGAFLTHPGLDCVCICTPSGLRLPIAEQAAAHKKHVVVEKPMEVTHERATRLMQVCQEQEVSLGCVLQYRFYPDVIRVKNLIASGKLGQITLVDAQVKWFRPDTYYTSSGWRGTWKMDGGGALMNQGIHTVDLMRFLAGEVRTIRSCAATLARPIETEDTVVAALQFENGALGTLAATTCAAPGLPAMLGIHGTLGSVILAGERLIYLQVPGETAINGFGSLDQSTSGGANPADIQTLGHEAMLCDMTQAILQGRQPVTAPADALKTLDLVLDVYKAAGFLPKE